MIGHLPCCRFALISVTLFLAFSGASAHGQPFCVDLVPTPTDEDIAGLVEAHLAKLPEEAAPQSEDLDAVFQAVADGLGCRLDDAVFGDDFEIGNVSRWSEASGVLSDLLPLGGSISFDQLCRENYCSFVNYCGKGNSLSNPMWLLSLGGHPRVSGDFNRLCFEHDKCYEGKCVQERCPFFGGPGSQTFICDSPFFTRCEGGGLSFKERIVCLIARTVSFVWPFFPQECGSSPCGSGEVCAWGAGLEGSAACSVQTQRCGVCESLTGAEICTVPLADSYGCGISIGGPCPSIGGGPGVLVSCEDTCGTGLCNNCCGATRCTSFEGSATRLSHPVETFDEFFANLDLCSGANSGGMAAIDDGFFVFNIEIFNLEVNGNTVAFDLCNILGAPCFGVPDGNGTLSIGESSFSGQFDLFGVDYSVSGSCPAP